MGTCMTLMVSFRSLKTMEQGHRDTAPGRIYFFFSQLPHFFQPLSSFPPSSFQVTLHSLAVLFLSSFHYFQVLTESSYTVVLSTWLLCMFSWCSEKGAVTRKLNRPLHDDWIVCMVLMPTGRVCSLPMYRDIAFQMFLIRDMLWTFPLHICIVQMTQWLHGGWARSPVPGLPPSLLLTEGGDMCSWFLTNINQQGLLPYFSVQLSALHWQAWGWGGSVETNIMRQ